MVRQIVVVESAAGSVAVQMEMRTDPACQMAKMQLLDLRLLLVD